MGERDSVRMVPPLKPPVATERWADRIQVMVYAPRNNEEVEVVESIMKAAVEWVTGAILL